jgi:hypothetical protein
MFLISKYHKGGRQATESAPKIVRTGIFVEVVNYPFLFTGHFLNILLQFGLQKT